MAGLAAGPVLAAAPWLALLAVVAGVGVEADAGEGECAAADAVTAGVAGLAGVLAVMGAGLAGPEAAMVRRGARSRRRLVVVASGVSAFAGAGPSAASPSPG